jgi:hypothetical protein
LVLSRLLLEELRVVIKQAMRISSFFLVTKGLLAKKITKNINRAVKTLEASTIIN